MARDFNRTANVNTNDDLSTQQLADEISELRKNEHSIRDMYLESYQNTWSPMSSDFPGLDSINHLGIPSTNPINESRYISTSYTKRRNTLPNPSPFSSHISSLRAVNRFHLEKIPEVVVTSTNGNQEANGNEPGPSSTIPHKFTVTPTNVNDINNRKM